MYYFLFILLTIKVICKAYITRLDCKMYKVTGFILKLLIIYNNLIKYIEYKIKNIQNLMV